jgi:hypothetical protein
LDTVRVARLLRRGIAPAAIVGFLLLYAMYGVLSVPAGMDTMPDSHPAGAVCVIAKRPSRVTVGAVVFVDVDGGTLLTRVAEVGDRDIAVRHDNPQSRFGDGSELGRLPIGAVRGLVLTTFLPSAVPRGRTE